MEQQWQLLRYLETDCFLYWNLWLLQGLGPKRLNAILMSLGGMVSILNAFLVSISFRSFFILSIVVCLKEYSLGTSNGFQKVYSYFQGWRWRVGEKKMLQHAFFNFTIFYVWDFSNASNAAVFFFPTDCLKHIFSVSPKYEYTFRKSLDVPDVPEIEKI